jgi:hypothetical protein
VEGFIDNADGLGSSLRLETVLATLVFEHELHAVKRYKAANPQVNRRP